VTGLNSQKHQPVKVFLIVEMPLDFFFFLRKVILISK